MDSPGSAVELPELPGIDTASALSFMNDNIQLYQKMLGKFLHSQRNFEEEFSTARTVSADPEAARRVAHTLKGSAGYIGAKGVQRAAAQLEMACAAGAKTEELDALLGEVIGELKPLIIALEKLDTSE